MVSSNGWILKAFEFSRSSRKSMRNWFIRVGWKVSWICAVLFLKGADRVQLLFNFKRELCKSAIQFDQKEENNSMLIEESTYLGVETFGKFRRFQCQAAQNLLVPYNITKDRWITLVRIESVRYPWYFEVSLCIQWETSKYHGYLTDSILTKVIQRSFVSFNYSPLFL